MNSGIACHRVHAEVEGSSIYLTVQTTTPGGGKTAQCPPADLGNIVPGKYMVFYGSLGQPIAPIGEVTVDR